MRLEVLIRRATPADAAALAEVHLRSAGEGFTNIFPPSDLRVSQQEMTRDWLTRLQMDEALQRTTFIAQVDTDIVGMLIAGRDPTDRTVGRVARLYVDPAYWNRGVAGPLLSECIEHLRSLGCRVATAWVMEPNHRARLVVERLGARLTGARQATCEKAASVPAGVEDLEYALLLTPPNEPAR